MGFCGECGSYLAPDLQGAFCPECGEAIPGAAPNASAPSRHVQFALASEADDSIQLREAAAIAPQREEAERQAQEARDRAEAMRLSAQNAILDYEAQQKAVLERESARIQQDLEAQRQQHLQVAQAARERRELAERLAQEKLAKAERLRAEAQAAQELMKKEEAKRLAKDKQREEARRLREEQARREENRRKAEDEARQAFEMKQQEEQLRQEAMRLSTLSVSSTSSNTSTTAPTTASNSCVGCRSALKPTQKFCLQCGTKVAAALSLNSKTLSAAPSSSGIQPLSLPLTNSSVSVASATSSVLISGDHKCTSCQTTLKATQKFCLKCGTKVSQAAPPPRAPSPASSVSSASSFSASDSLVAALSACVKCSQPLKSAQKFCLLCGTKVTVAASTPNLSASFSSSSSSYTSVPLPAPIPTTGSWSSPASQPNLKNCPTCSKGCKSTAKFCVGCGFNYAKSDEEEVARNIEAARQRQQQLRDRELQQRSQASLMANQAAQAYQPSW
ncbi:hypothetical protein CCR75_002621 [Bremia lactucae]|uniref:DZANK-type domain-containing protein n=1 Tax=Bremia lactucae TaxID=4779 RepID=A0A976ILC3_BRELC|nr:hypothetical protein CCR75_002621 [Bremia lactucae]